MEMPEGWKLLDKITNEPTNKGACTGWPKKDARKYLDLMEEMAEALETANIHIGGPNGEISFPKVKEALQKFKEWK